MTIAQLTYEWLAAKAAEDNAKAKRYEVEKSLIGLLPTKEEGTVSELTGDHKISVTYKLTRKADAAALKACWNELSKEAQSCFRWNADVSLSDMRKASESGQYEAAHFITTAPAKPAIKIEEINHGN